MPLKITPEAQANWDNHIRNYLSSGLTIKQYCQSQQLTHHQFKYQWDRYRRQKKSRATTQTARSQAFTKVHIQAAHPSNGHDHYELRCPNGVRCRLPVDLNKAQALKMLKELLS